MNNIFLKKPETCPKYGSERIAYILYGLSHFTKELNSEITEQKIVLGVTRKFK